MPGFTITPVTGSAPPAESDFPRFLQFQLDSEDLGDTSVETVNFVGNVDATLSTDGSSIEVDVGAGFSWRDVSADHTLDLTDADSGISTSGNSGAQVITIPSDGQVDFRDGTSIMVMQYGAAPVSFVAASGVQLLVRSGLLAALSGQYATATLIKRTANVWIVCGDLDT